VQPSGPAARCGRCLCMHWLVALHLPQPLHIAQHLAANCSGVRGLCVPTGGGRPGWRRWPAAAGGGHGAAAAIWRPVRGALYAVYSIQSVIPEDCWGADGCSLDRGTPPDWCGSRACPRMLGPRMTIDTSLQVNLGQSSPPAKHAAHVYLSRQYDAQQDATRGLCAHSICSHECNTYFPLHAGWRACQPATGGCASHQRCRAAPFIPAVTSLHWETTLKHDMAANRILRDRPAALGNRQQQHDSCGQLPATR